MTMPLQAGNPLETEDWESVRLRTIFQCCKWDVQSEDHCVLARFPLLLPGKERDRLTQWAESLSTEALAAEREILREEELHRKLGLPRRVRQALRKYQEPDSSAGTARVMRFDFHFTSEGWRLSEANTDVPGGFVEASGFTELMCAHFPGTALPPSPVRIYADSIQNATHPGALVALVHATAYTDDRQVMEYLAGELHSRGLRTCMLSPEHLRWCDGRAHIQCRFASGAPDLLVRFFPAEWLPNLDNTSAWRGYFRGAKTPISNPGTALLTQTKRFALVWNELAQPLPTWRSLMPETMCPSEIDNVWSGDWVLKPALGRVGDAVAIPGVASRRQWEDTKKDVRRHPSEWAAQRRFEAVPIEVDGKRYFPCLGVFTIDGHAAGIYGRIAEKPLVDGDAQDVAVLIPAQERYAK